MAPELFRAKDNLIAGKVQAITNGLKQSFAATLFREFSIESGRVDIRIDIRTSTGEKFLVFVENKKVWDAQEVGPIPQTLRYEKRLKEEEENGVLGLGIYLTPDQKPAESKLFAPVSCERFAACLRKRLSAKEIKMSDDASASILLYAFALTYAWMN